MDTLLITTLKDIFKQFSQFWSGENLQRSLVIDAIQKKDPQIIKALIANEKIKSIYGTEIDGVLVFDFDKLVSLLKYKEYWADSFTKYRNKVGLTSEGKYLDYSSDVVLDFPFKDCVLEGGMTKEDQGKEEVYYNEVIARDEIDRLFSPKVFTNSKRYTREGVEESINIFNNDDNLIIKGNNLVALHSLKERYAGQVKLIYIDPPFNTGGDDFKYNDRFNHSTWLTFMKNRLEVAKDLLSKCGTLVVHIGNEESAYTKILLDEILGINNFLNQITITTNAASGFKATGAKIFSTSNHIYVYAKDISNININKIYIKKSYDYAYKYLILNKNEHFSKWKYESVIEYIAKEKNFNSASEWKKNTSKSEVNESIEFFCDKNRNNVFRLAAISGGALKKRKKTIDISKNLRNEVIQHENEDVEGFYILNGEQIVFWGNTYQEIDGEICPSQTLTDVWTDISFTGIASEGKVTLKNAKKPEKLIKRIIQLFTNNGDLVLDYHLGSGTTCAVAHKMGRRYIGIEQMDYINEITVPRLQKVIEGEQGGISKSVDWKGGGSFVYTELMELNYIFIHQIEQAKNSEELFQLFEIMKAEAHLNYQIALDKVLGAEYEIDGVDHFVSFNDLDLFEQKKLLIEVLDKNQLYVNASEMDDANLAISESDKSFTKSFYQKDC